MPSDVADRRAAPSATRIAGRYASGPFLAVLQGAGVVRSLSRPGPPLDNAVSESFFSTLVRELVFERRFATRAEARPAICEYVEVFYNRERRHSTLGYLRPADFEAQPRYP